MLAIEAEGMRVVPSQLQGIAILQESLSLGLTTLRVITKLPAMLRI
jgi:hypothetical protein